MRIVLTFLIMVAVMTTSACASKNGVPDTTDAPSRRVATAPESTGESAVGSAVQASETPATVPDPWEGFNRKVHGFNNIADDYVLRPLARGYDWITPEPVQAGVSRFFANLRIPLTAVNQVLQGRGTDAIESLGRFVVNTTVGIGGVFDPAAGIGLSKRQDEDFGLTFATWGWRDSRYLVLPLFGPRTLRDTLGLVGDQALSPIRQVQDSSVSTGLQVAQIVDVRTRMLPVDKFRREAFDDYLFVRDAWSQRRIKAMQKD